MSLLRLLDRFAGDQFAGLARRPPLWQADFPFILLWSHKAASTVLAHWFFAQIGSPQLRAGLQDAERLYSGLGIHKYQFKIFCRSPGYLNECERRMRAGFPIIKFVRDPAARAFSGFLSARRHAVLHKPQFWGAKVNRQIIAQLSVAQGDPAFAYSFADFVEWLAVTSPDRQNNHVRAQFIEFESRQRIEVIPIEGLSHELAGLEERFGLSRLAAKEGLLESGHHRLKSGDIVDAELESLLRRPVPLGMFEAQPPPVVDSTRLAGTVLGDRLREVCAADYAAYRIY